jgi:hypothetical protein
MNQPNRTSGDQAEMDESQKTMSLMGGIVRAEELPGADGMLEGGRTGIKLGQGSMVILMVAAIAIGSIYLMRLTQGDLSSGKEFREAEARIEQALAKLSNSQAMAADDPLRRENLDSLLQDTNSIVSMFNTDMTHRQVPIEEIQKDPFELTPTEQVVIVPTRSDEEARRAERERQRQQQLRTEFSRLRLQTVMQGRMPVAIINGDFVRVGGAIGSFTVRSIDGMTVELEADGQVFPLTMQDSEPRSGSSPSRR